MKEEGFWDDSWGNYEGIFPQKNDKPWNGWKEFVDNLSVLEETLLLDHRKSNNDKYVYGYRGSSRCRICDVCNGSLEFSIGGWRWPIGYKHYIVEHFVEPSEEFKNFIFDSVKKIKEEEENEIKKGR